MPSASAASVNPPPSGLPHIAGLTTQKFEAVKRVQELVAQMGFRQDPEFDPLMNMFRGQIPPEVSIQPKPSKAPVLRLDPLGREIDEHGNVIMPKINNLSTLKVYLYFLGMVSDSLIFVLTLYFEFFIQNNLCEFYVYAGSSRLTSTSRKRMPSRYLNLSWKLTLKRIPIMMEGWELTKTRS